MMIIWGTVGRDKDNMDVAQGWGWPLKNDDPGIRFVRGTGLGLSKAVVEVSYQLAHHSIG